MIHSFIFYYVLIRELFMLKHEFMSVLMRCHVLMRHRILMKSYILLYINIFTLQKLFFYYMYKFSVSLTFCACHFNFANKFLEREDRNSARSKERRMNKEERVLTRNS